MYHHVATWGFRLAFSMPKTHFCILQHRLLIHCIIMTALAITRVDTQTLLLVSVQTTWAEMYWWKLWRYFRHFCWQKHVRWLLTNHLHNGNTSLATLWGYCFETGPGIIDSKREVSWRIWRPFYRCNNHSTVTPLSILRENHLSGSWFLSFARLSTMEL